MFVHIFSFIWNADAPKEAPARATAEIEAFQGIVPGLRSIYLGENISPRSAAYGTTGVMLFDSPEHFKAYVTHPAHLALLDWLVPLIEALELDFEVNGI